MTDAVATTADLLLRRVGDPKPGLLFEDETHTWDDVVHEGARRAALALQHRVDGPFHVGVLLDNTPEYLFWIVAAGLSGAAVVGINSTRRGSELAHDIGHTDCQLIVTDTEHVGLLDGLDLGLGDDRLLLVDTPGYHAALATHDDASAADLAAGVTPAEPLLLLFTSGSTGAPKAVVCTQARFAAIAGRTPAMFGITAEDSVCYNAMPMFHGNALMASWAMCLGSGAPWALRRRFSASGFLGDIRRFGATYVNYVGRALAYVLATPEQPDDADNTLRLAFGTEATDRDMAEFGRRFGCAFFESYGSSEGPISILKSPDSPPHSLGREQEGDVAVIDPETLEECPRARFGPNGELVNHDAIGELVRRDTVTFEGYYNNPEATAERLRNGWYWSGDLGYRDDDGWFYFAGRGADRLRVDSENFAATPIERIVARFDGVLVNAVYPVPDSRTGDQVMVAIELVPGHGFDAGAFDDFLTTQEDLGTKWAPRFVRVVEEMPLTGSNKLDKKPLRAQRWDTPGAVWWRPEPGARLRPMSDDDRAALAGEFEANGLGHLLV
jgi:fatty-acyl-CoA synthase